MRAHTHVRAGSRYSGTSKTWKLARVQILQSDFIAKLVLVLREKRKQKCPLRMLVDVLTYK